jgi:hypothetical protein
MRAGHSTAFGEVTSRLSASGVIILAGLAVLSGVYANFVDTRAAGPVPIATGQVHIVLGTPSGDHGAVTVGPIHNLAENDTVARVVQLTNNVTVGAAGTTGLATVRGLTLQTAVSGPNAGSDIVTDTTNGLHVTVQSCTVAPVETGGPTGPWTYTCAPGFATVFANAALGTLDTTARNITASAPIEGATVFYVLTVHLPRTYADSYNYQGGVCSTLGVPGVTEQLQNCTLSITYNFVATQRAAAKQ